MISNKVSDIISMLIETTNSLDLAWCVKNTARDTGYNNERLLSALSEDGLSEFEANIRFQLVNDDWVMETSCGVWIKNKELPSGGMYLISSTYPGVLKLRDILKNKYCSDLVPSSDKVIDSLSNILKNISKSVYRDNVITKVFGDGR